MTFNFNEYRLGQAALNLGSQNKECIAISKFKPKHLHKKENVMTQHWQNLNFKTQYIVNIQMCVRYY